MKEEFNKSVLVSVSLIENFILLILGGSTLFKSLFGGDDLKTWEFVFLLLLFTTFFSVVWPLFLWFDVTVVDFLLLLEACF